MRQYKLSLLIAIDHHPVNVCDCNADFTSSRAVITGEIGKRRMSATLKT